MARAFSTWSPRIAAASDDGTRRALVGEIGVWRAQRLMDIAAQRAAAYGLSVLYEALGQRDAALHEAKQLVSLCRSAPEATRDERRVAEGHLRHLTGGRSGSRGRDKGGKPRAKGSSGTSKAGKGRDKASTKDGDRGRSRGAEAWEAVRAAARDGDFSGAIEALGRKGGAKAATFRLWARLSAALARPEAERLGAVKAIVDDIAPELAPRDAAPAPAPNAPTPSGPPETALGELLGQRLPKRREGLIAAVDAHLEAHPDDLDAVAAGALRHHLHHFGPKRVAPWLVTWTGRALAAGEAPKTKAALADLAEQGSYAVTAYDEAPFGMLVEVLAATDAAAQRTASLRRGVMRRGEPKDRRLWTLRLTLDGHERMLVAGGDTTDPYDDALAATLAQRLTELADRVVVVAPGGGHAGFRAACVALGLTALDALDPDAVVAALGSAAPHPAAEARAAEAAAAPSSDEAPSAGARTEAAPADAPASRAPAKPRTPSPQDVIGDLFTGDGIAPSTAYVPELNKLRRIFHGFSPLRRPLRDLDPEVADARFAPFLVAADEAAPEGIRLSEGTSHAIRVAAAAPGGQVEAMLTGDGPVAERFGGAGIGAVVDLVRAAMADGWALDRVLSGPTRREQRTHEALSALGDDLGGLWRLLLDRPGNRRDKVELWYLADLTAEGKAAVPLLLLEDRRRVLRVAPDQGLEAWLAGQGHDGVAAWHGTPDEAAVVVKALSTYAPEQAPPADTEAARETVAEGSTADAASTDEAADAASTDEAADAASTDEAAPGQATAPGEGTAGSEAPPAEAPASTAPPTDAPASTAAASPTSTAPAASPTSQPAEGSPPSTTPTDTDPSA